ncbi:MAG: B12-binding domain-containing radical SAM protein [Candidatus Thermoplasmatota archaeon]|nr:B12-binding domain-containing radical SAM protein [Candidatus Thermoplasmatota archaeon]
MKFTLFEVASMPYSKKGKISKFPPLGLLYIAASLEQNNHIVNVIDIGMEYLDENKLTRIISDSDAIGITVFTSYIEEVNQLINQIKKIDSSIPVIIGGPHCIFFKEQALKQISNADIAVIGEGEKTIIEIADYLKGKKKIHDIKGIYYREKEKIRKAKPYKIITDLDQLPIPSRHLVEKYEYRSLILENTFTSMLTTRGCPYHCRFCARYSNVLKKYTFRSRSIPNIIDELQEIEKKYKSVMIVDDTFLVNTKKAEKIMDCIIEQKIDLHFYIQGARVDSANKNLYEKMKKAGVKYLSYGIESGNQTILNYYRKGITIKQIKKAVDLAKEFGFITKGNFILGAPIETEPQIRKTIAFACSLPLDLVDFSPFMYHKGSYFWQQAVQKGLIRKEVHVVIANSTDNPGNNSSDKVIGLCGKAYRKFYFQPSFLFRQTKKYINMKNAKYIKIPMKFMINSLSIEKELKEQYYIYSKTKEQNNNISDYILH